jgi:hypothetical protein
MGSLYLLIVLSSMELSNNLSKCERCIMEGRILEQNYTKGYDLYVDRKGYNL